MTGDAEFSSDGLYRWWLSRHLFCKVEVKG